MTAPLIAMQLERQRTRQGLREKCTELENAIEYHKGQIALFEAELATWQKALARLAEFDAQQTEPPHA